MSANHKVAPMLFRAIQSGDEDTLRQALEQLRTIAAVDEMLHDAQKHASSPAWKAPDLVNETYGELGLTALHLACKAYAVRHSAGQAQVAGVFDAMVQALLDAGACPYLPIGRRLTPRFNPVSGRCELSVVDAGRTIAEECGRHQPPALRAWHAAHPSVVTGHDLLQKHSSTLRREAEQAAILQPESDWMADCAEAA